MPRAVDSRSGQRPERRFEELSGLVPQACCGDRIHAPEAGRRGRRRASSSPPSCRAIAPRAIESAANAGGRPIARFDRYVAGEHQAVWKELVELGRTCAGMPSPRTRSQWPTRRWSACNENVRMLVERLDALGYRFSSNPPHQPPGKRTWKQLAAARTPRRPASPLASCLLRRRRRRRSASAAIRGLIPRNSWWTAGERRRFHRIRWWSTAWTTRCRKRSRWTTKSGRDHDCAGRPAQGKRERRRCVCDCRYPTLAPTPSC